MGMAIARIKECFVSVKEIELAISQLSQNEFSEFAEWFAAYRAALWDKEIEEDLKVGRFDPLIQEVRADIQTR